MGMPVFCVNGSPNAVMADFLQLPPNMKAVTGGSAAALGRAQYGSIASAAVPANALPSALMNSRRSRLRVASRIARSRAQVSSTSISFRLCTIEQVRCRATFRQRLGYGGAGEGEDGKPDQDRGGGGDGRVGGRLYARPDLHRHRLADAAEDEGRDQ